ncbi:hypothetical protein [Enterococcus faecalis]|uniref:Cobalt transport protein n=1 Tax=Enterococcus faecalis RP2S-4 TaxID=1244145 RepID=A0ABC9TPC7_ENTFL|nr:hypothetical protein [Enterococcus faecalis]EPI08706.1 hypothetical protein D358_01481 [Enterococcus faecalis RP2S-4]
MSKIKYIGFLLLAFFIYTNLYTGLTFSFPVFLAILAMIIFWKITLKVAGLFGKVVLFFVALIFFQY